MRNDPILMHYGVKGMKWRKRKGIGLKEGVQNASKPSSIIAGAGHGAVMGKDAYTNVYKKRQDQLKKKPKVSKEYEEEKNYNSQKNKYPEGFKSATSKAPTSKLKKENKQRALVKGMGVGAELAKQLAATPKQPKSKLKKKK